MTTLPTTNKPIDPEADRRREIELLREEGWDEEGNPEELRICEMCETLMEFEDPGVVTETGVVCKHCDENGELFGGN